MILLRDRYPGRPTNGSISQYKLKTQLTEISTPALSFAMLSTVHRA